MEFFNIFEICIGAYLLYCGISGKGKYYENQYCKVSREQYVKIMRIFALVVGALILVSPILQLLKVIEASSALSWVLWVVNMIGIIGMLVANVRMTDRAKAKAAQNGQRTASPSNPDPLRAAFVFDDEDAAKKDADPVAADDKKSAGQ